MTERAEPNLSKNEEKSKKVSSLSFRLCAGCGRLEGRSTSPGSNSVEQLIFAAVVYSLSSSRQVEEALRAVEA